MIKIIKVNMFDIRPHCLSDLPNNEYITYHIGCDNDHNNNQKTPLTKLNYVLSKGIIFDNQNK